MRHGLRSHSCEPEPEPELEKMLYMKLDRMNVETPNDGMTSDIIIVSLRKSIVFEHILQKTRQFQLIQKLQTLV